MEKTYEKRKVEVYRNDNWIECQMKDLCVGDKFRMFEFPEFTEFVSDECGNTEFEVIKEPYINDKEVWTVNVLPKGKFNEN